MQKFIVPSSGGVYVPLPNPYNSGYEVTWSLVQIEPAGTVLNQNGTTFYNLDGSTAVLLSLPAADLGIRGIFRLTYTIDGAVAIMDFMAESEETLVKGVNSYQSYYQVQMLMEEISGLDFLKAMPKSDQIAALISAYDIINTSTFVDNTGEHYDIGSYDAAKLDTLEPGFLRALRIAQIIEANEMLDLNSIHYKRLDGLMSETIGESSMMFRPGNIQNFAITRRSMLFLRNYLIIWARLYRA